MLRGIAVTFALLGTLSLWGSLEAFLLGGTVPVAGSGLRLVAAVGLVVGAAHLYAARGIWTLRRRGWQVGLWLAGAGTLLSCLVLVGGATSGLVGMLVSGAIGWGLHVNREPFRDPPVARAGRASGADDSDTCQSPGGQQAVTDRASGYASRRRGRH